MASDQKDSEVMKTMMVMEDDCSYPIQNQNGEEEENNLSLQVGVEDDDVIMAEIETDLMFDEAFPSLPDFPSLSSPSNAAYPSSSSSSNSSSSSQSSATWAPNRHEEHHHDHDHHYDHRDQHADGQASSSTIIGDYQVEGMDLLGESWDPFSLFPDEGGTEEPIFLERDNLILQNQMLALEEDKEEGDCTSQELASVFLEWLKNNKETISPEDLRSIKLKRATIETAARTLGGGKEGMKKLLQLILTWVQNNHLQKKRSRLSLSTPDPFNFEEDPEISYLYDQSQSFLAYQAPPLSSFSTLGSSATKEARKKRMARQRRYSSLHHSQNLQRTQQPSPSLPGERAFRSFPSSSSQQLVVNGGATATIMSHQDNRQEWRSEKNLRFLLQKVLKQSDVGSLGRIVLPKKEAEMHLPELETRDGITLVMEDIVTSRTWNMRYRFWPNNKSRMYLLENTGDFVRSNGLQEGDFIVIYSDIKCGKYMIRGVKVRQSTDIICVGEGSREG